MTPADHVPAAYYDDGTVVIHAGDCVDVMRGMPACSVDAVVTDPPYGLEFMGKDWDSFGPQRSASTAGRVGEGAITAGSGFGDGTFKDFKFPAFGLNKPSTYRCSECGKRDQFRNPHPCGDKWVKEPIYEGAPRQMLAFQSWCEAWAVECLRVLRPGGHMLAFGGTRTWHRLACAVEDAGFEIRDSIAWLYGSGFPKSLDVSKAIDKAAGATREVVGYRNPSGSAIAGRAERDSTGSHIWTGELRSSDAVTDAARQWQGWGTALKPAFEPIVVARKPLAGTVAANVQAHGTGALNIDACRVGSGGQLKWAQPRDMGYHGGTDSGSTEATSSALGRWPANVVLDDAAAAELDRQVPNASVNNPARWVGGTGITDGWGNIGKAEAGGVRGGYGDSGGASRFFPVFRYEPKAPTAERPRGDDGTAHPTVKPLDLMRWLVRLVTPPGGVVLDPFLGSGTTAEACVIEGFRCVGIEREVAYLPLIVARLSKPIAPVLFADP